MSSHPDADAFVRGYLRTPTDATTRLVFADWLEETGTPSNVAWAHYIRAKVETDRPECAARAAEHAPDIRARLTIPAKLFAGYPKSLLELLPAPNITVRLADYAIPQAVLELVPESVARENLVLPLDLRGRLLFVVTTDPQNRETVEKFEFILNKDVVAVRGDAEDIRAALDRQYGHTETESFDSCVLYEFPDPPRPSAH